MQLKSIWKNDEFVLHETPLKLFYSESYVGKNNPKMCVYDEKKCKIKLISYSFCKVGVQLATFLIFHQVRARKLMRI